MYIKVYTICHIWCYKIFAGNGKPIFDSCNATLKRSTAVRAAKKMAKKLNIEYREN